jgi:hypothetical protein
MSPRLAPTLALGVVVGVLIGQRLPSQLSINEMSAQPTGMATSGVSSLDSHRRLQEVEDEGRRKLSAVTDYFRDTDVSATLRLLSATNIIHVYKSILVHHTH